ncbi:cytochrome b-c1 complex subunit 1, mitochondrial [Pantherophis guttatus]|uniref:Cytochrome b-c1 complex subunit 1, mitochondrial n=1 Tax=Pantherophis guttatus TaxID=94885 RepID=A0A6P9CVX1_PANGU|nr:cytochrome b-c1 complex subunit 1, mitochondrial [Pantherophis guttatus]
MAAGSVYRALGSVASRALLRGSCAPRSLQGLVKRGSTATYANVLSNLPETEVTTLDNGLRIASEKSNHPTCTVGVWINVGSRYETEKNNGVGNFMEHLAFKGTSKYPYAQFEKEVEGIGAHLDSYYSREKTAFYMKILPKDLPKAIEILAEITQNCSLEDSQIEKERNVILQEMKESDSCLSAVLFDYLHASAYQGTPLAQTAEGTTANIKKLTRADITEYMGNHIKAPRMVLVAAGDVGHTELVDLAQQHFGSVSFKYKADTMPVLSQSRFSGSQVTVRDDELPLAHVAFAVEGPGWGSPDNLVLLLINSIIGRYDFTFGGSKNLYSRMAADFAEHDLCRSFQTFNISYSDTGLFGFYFVTDCFNILHSSDWGRYEWMRICTDLPEHDLERGKKVLRRNLVAQLDGTTPMCESIATQLLSYGRRIPLAEWDARISEINTQMVQDVCSKYVYDKCPVVAGVGPVEQLLDYNYNRTWTYLNRY